MLDDRTVLAHALLPGRRLGSNQHLLNGLIADGVGGDLAVGLPVLLQGGDQFVLGVDPHAAVVRRGDAWRILGEGAREEGRFDAAVHPELDARQPDPVDVALVEVRPHRKEVGARLAVGVRAALLDLVGGIDDPRRGRGLGEHDKVDGQELLVDDGRDDRNVVAAQSQPHLARRGHSILDPELSGPLDTLPGLGLRQGLAGRQDRHPCRFGGMALELAPPRQAVEKAALRVGGIGTQLHFLHQGGVEDPMVAGSIGNADRTGGAHRVEFCPRRVTLLGHLLGPVAHADNPIALGGFRGVRLQAGQQFGNVPDASEIGVEHGVGGVDQVAMGVDEPWHEGRTGQVDLAGILPGGAKSVRTLADIENLAVLLDQGLDIGWGRPLHGQDVPAAIDGGRRREGGGAEHQAGDEPCGGGDSHLQSPVSIVTGPGPGLGGG